VDQIDRPGERRDGEPGGTGKMHKTELRKQYGGLFSWLESALLYRARTTRDA